MNIGLIAGMAAAFAVAIAVLVGVMIRQRRAMATLRASTDALSSDQRTRAAIDAERERIYRDLHDDIGGRLLTLVHGSSDPEVAAIAREVLQDLRSVVSRTHAADGTLLEILAQIRDEMEQRLDTVGVTLVWQQVADLPDPHLLEAKALHLYRIAREAVSNAVRHARPSRIRVRVSATDSMLLMDFTDDGAGMPADRVGTGRGTSSMVERAQELRGDIGWNPGTEGGTKVVLRVPLPPSAGSPDAAGTA